MHYRHHIRKVLTRDRLPKNGFLMEESIIQTTENNVVVRDWSLKTQKEKGDSLVKGCIANLPEHVTMNVHQNNLEDLVQVWNQWDSDTRGIFTERYEDIASLIAVNIDEKLIQAMTRFWDSAYQKKLVKLTGLTDTWAEKQIKKKNEISCILWFSLRDLILNHPDILKGVNLFALAIYGLVIFPKVLGHTEVAVVDFFEKLKQGINPIPTILAETFRSLSSCRRKGERRFIGCAQLLNRTQYYMFSKTFTPLEAYLEKEWPKDVTEEHWVSVFQNLRAEDVTWRAPWIRPLVLLYKVGNQDWVPLLGLWGRVGLAQSKFAFAGEGYMKRDYDVWRKQRVNSQQVSSMNYTFQNPFSEEIPSELEMARLEFEQEKAKMSRDLNALQEENYQLKIDVQIERSRAEKVQKEVEIVRNDLRDLHLENKKLRGTIKNSVLGKSSAKWKEELSNIKGGMELWKGKAKKEEEKAAQAMMELRKKNAEYEAVSAGVMTSRSKLQKLK
ncbi:hypothetical protein V6Z11_A11G235500 [Gossypium hirsutum]